LWAKLACNFGGCLKKTQDCVLTYLPIALQY
jgi:hypothetical protein